MAVKQSEENKHNGSDIKKMESTVGTFERNEEHATYCYFRTVMLMIPFVTMVSVRFLHKTHILFNNILIFRTYLILTIII